MTETLNLPGVTLETRDEAELAAAFGVTDNAEQLIKFNRERYSPQQKAALAKGVNPALSARVQEREEFDPEAAQYGAPANAVEAALEEHVGHAVETAVVRGSGRAAQISYTYINERGSIDKGLVPYVEVFGSSGAKKAAAAERDPDEAAQAAADRVLKEAEREAAEKRAAAEAEARRLIEEAAAKAQEKLREAESDAEEVRRKATEEAPKAAEDAADDAEDEAKKAAARGAAKPAAKRSGSSSRSRSSGSRKS
jgi:hypothetical protein